jgi:hypothetical protein
MHGYKRPHGSATERAFIDRYLLSLSGAYEDRIGNIHVIREPTRGIVWSTHTDTVHDDEGRQSVLYDRRLSALYLPLESDSSCLGADDTAGVWLAREMILAGVTGHFVFHTGEERGGIGSSFLACEETTWMAHQRIVIALDRAGSSDVITHQYGRRTASDTFAESLAREIMRIDPRLSYRPCRGGVYTDSAEYADHVAECTNLSVGYGRQHTAREYLDVRHLMRLRRALIALDPEALIVAREAHAFWDPAWLVDPREGSIYLSEEYEALAAYEKALADDDDRWRRA